MEVNSFQIIFTFNMFKIWHLKGHIFLRKARYSRRRSSGPCGGRCVIITYHKKYLIVTCWVIAKNE